MHIDPVPAHMAMRVCARDFHVSEYTTITKACKPMLSHKPNRLAFYIEEVYD